MMIDFEILNAIKGFLDDEEAIRLHTIAKEASKLGPILEIGSYCGKSGYILGLACQETGSILFTIDHHNGSEEQQPGEEYFDPDLLDESNGTINTFPFLKEMIKSNELENTMVPIVASSKVAGKMWKTPISMLFIDGGHSFAAADTDYRTWSPHLMSGGLLVIHDIFLDPAKGGQAPRQVYENAFASGNYSALKMTKTLGVLQKL
ncbi:MAG: class I SAM-dependent methyltransferase [Desulfobacteraceae bacterium]|nr:class I SAM-dependent methyltransferase [Desulfobacteraceae bacterium]